MKIRSVTCFGSGQGKAGEPIYDTMVEVGRLLALEKVSLITGGYGGAGMEAPAKGAKEAGAVVVGYHLGRHSANKPNPYLTSASDSSFEGYNDECPPRPQYTDLTSTYVSRLGDLLSSDAFVVAGGMGPGTLVEFLAVVNLNEKMWPVQRRVALVHPCRHKSSLRDLALEPEFVTKDNRLLAALGFMAQWPRYLEITSTAQRAVDWVLWKRNE